MQNLEREQGLFHWLVHLRVFLVLPRSQVALGNAPAGEALLRGGGKERGE